MDDPTVILFDAAWDKDLLEREIHSYEATSGPITAIGVTNDPTVGTYTAGTFDSDADSPEKRTKILPIVDGHFSMPAGAAEVCRGFAFLDGTATPVVLAR
ncbi:MAG: hypothetical protein J0J06_02375 [Sphingomonas sp.]|uniref:hypothetical protein n=1 Tax=Sphingomonas sp. TaxID=28214 RepID=UPI001ACC5E94|nr:hypothetical protein [Sphingomonas sp.]MBN8814275.1 hypothetical protein [Sphingomonas sp.]